MTILVFVSSERANSKCKHLVLFIISSSSIFFSNCFSAFVMTTTHVLDYQSNRERILLKKKRKTKLFIEAVAACDEAIKKPHVILKRKINEKK